jgi:hypothetical protein
MAVRLFVGNLPYTANETEVRAHFATVGPVASVWLPMDRETGRPRGFAFVEFADPAHAQEAIRRFNNQPFGGRNLSVNEARPQERSSGPPRREGPGGGGFAGGPPRRESGGYGGPPRSADGGPGGGYGQGGGFSPRPAGGGAPRPFGDDRGFAPPDPDAGRGERWRSFGPDAQPRRARKGGKGRSRGDDRDRAPKGPLGVRTTGRFYGADDDEYSDMDDLNLEDEFADVDEELEGDEPEGEELEGDEPEGEELEGDGPEGDELGDDDAGPSPRRR